MAAHEPDPARRDAAGGERLDWVVLTRGDRQEALLDAVESIRSSASVGAVIVIVNGPTGEAGGQLVEFAERDVHVHQMPENLGIPGGRDVGLRLTTSAHVGFLDDDARIETDGAGQFVLDQFAADPTLGAVSMRLVDESGQTSRRHVPRRGAGGADQSGQVATFLGGACVIKRSAYEHVGGYWSTLFYGHEELDLAWRLIDAGYSIRYDAATVVFHPRTAISRHAQGWWYTGRNRVLVARRSLPLPLLLGHTCCWLLIGAARAPGWRCRRSYLAGWFGGWSERIDRRPMSWSAVWRLRRLNRFPLV